jgi:hypothetical protein
MGKFNKELSKKIALETMGGGGDEPPDTQVKHVVIRN